MIIAFLGALVLAAPGDPGLRLGLSAGAALPAGTAIEVDGGSAPLSDFSTAMFPLSAVCGVRVGPHLALDASFEFTPSIHTSSGALNSNTGSSIAMRAAAEWHFSPLATLDPWLAAGAGYEWSSFTESSNTDREDDKLQGPELHLRAGFDLRRGAVSFGPFLEALAGTLSGCKKDEAKADILPAASALAPSTAVPRAKVVRYAIDAAGKTSIDMPAPEERIKADTESAGGALDVDLTNLANTRGEVKVDVAELTTHTFGNSDDPDQTKHAREWLEVGDTVAPAVKDQNRWVVFAIRSIDGLGATDISKVTPTKDGGDDVRTVALKARGDLLLHQHKAAEKTASLEVVFHYPAGAAADSKPTSIQIKSKDPLQVTLADHDVKPRDAEGKLAQEALGLLGTKVADIAYVSFDLKATPAG